MYPSPAGLRATTASLRAALCHAGRVLCVLPLCVGAKNEIQQRAQKTLNKNYKK